MTAIILRESGSGNNDPEPLLVRALELFREGYRKRTVDRQDAERRCREALLSLRNAYLLSKNTKIRKLLHRYGRKVHDLFRCQFQFNDGSYSQTCPVALSHLKYGVSPGISGTEICSICESNMLDCEHVKGRIYHGVSARKIEDICNICREKSCGHSIGQCYDSVMAIAFMQNLRADHIAIVENPKDPLAAIMSTTISREEILRSLPAHEKRIFEYGKTVLYCHHCLDCKGGATE